MNINEFRNLFPDREVCCQFYRYHEIAAALHEAAATYLADDHQFHGQFQQGGDPVFKGKWTGARQKTAWKIGHAVRVLIKLHGDSVCTLEGVVELDEKYPGGRSRFIQGGRGIGIRKS